MEKYIDLNYKYAMPFIEEKDLAKIQTEINKARKTLNEKSGLGNDFIGWVNLPSEIDPDIVNDIHETAKEIRKHSNVLVVIGIGGSYLGAKAVIEVLTPYFTKRKNLEIIFAGQNISSTYLSELSEYLENKNFSINVISKSGTTTEPALAFRYLKKLLESKVGKEEAKRRIFATTDRSRGALRTLADKNGYKTFVVPDDVGGRYSVLTPVGLLPIAAAGINIKQLLRGAKAAKRAYTKLNIYKNDVHMYVALRNLFYRNGYPIEMLVNYEPKLAFIAEWWKQLFGESEGKDHKGLFISSASFTTDLHSLGQYIQDGERILFETVLNVGKPKKDLVLKEDKLNLDGLNYLAGESLDYINKQALKGTLLAHNEGGVPNIVINIPEITPYSVGYLIYFFELACGISGYVLEVNPFNQPGVETYKKNMFALLGKPGYEDLRDNLLKKL